MSHHQDGAALLVQLGEQVQDDALVGRVQVAGRFVGQNDLGIVHQGPRDGHALLLAARKLRWQVARAVGKSHAIERAAGFAFVRHAVEVLRQHHVFERGQVRDQVELLEYEAHGVGAKAGQLGAGQSGGIHGIDAHRAVRGLVETAQDIQQRRLARSRRTHDRDPLAGFRGEADAVERLHRRGPRSGGHPFIRLRDVFQFDECHGFYSPRKITAGLMRQMRAAAASVAAAAIASVTPATGRNTP